MNTVTPEAAPADPTQGYCVGCGEFTIGTFVQVLNASSDSVKGQECYPPAAQPPTRTRQRSAGSTRSAVSTGRPAAS